jgi:hypothetical protein
MEAGITALSCNFMARYHLLALMKDIIDTDPDHTPLAERTIDYFITAYITRYAHTQHYLHLRYIDDPHDNDVDDEGNPRHLSRTDIMGIFAAQSEWIFADQFAKRVEKRVVSPDTWQTFCARVRRDRRDARRRGVVWGLPFGEPNDDDYEDYIDLTRYRILGKDMVKLQEAATKKKKAVSTLSRTSLLFSFSNGHSMISQLQASTPIHRLPSLPQTKRFTIYTTRISLNLPLQGRPTRNPRLKTWTLSLLLRFPDSSFSNPSYQVRASRGVALPLHATTRSTCWS